MRRFVVAVLYPTLLLPLYLAWSRGQAERQIDKMQRAVFNTPGAESPLPPAVIVGGVGLLGGYGLLTQGVGVRGWPRLLALVVGVPLGIALFLLRPAGRG
jgi:hypothetical protein